MRTFGTFARRYVASCFRHGIPPSARARFVRPASVHAQGKVALFEDLYGNLRDLVQFADGR